MDVSVIIPTYQAESSLGSCLKAIYSQKAKYSFEVICIDSGSTDGTLEYCREYPVRLFEIDNSEFNHGLTRNLGADRAKGRYIVFITQDALPSGELWLQNLAYELDSDERIAGVYSRQIPHEDATCLTKRQLNNWLTGRIDREVRFISDRQSYENLTPVEKYMFCNFDNVCSCVRKSVWQQFPFKKTYFGEDLEWSKEVLEAGYKIVYQPNAAVLHSHKRSILYEYRRTYLCHRKIYSLFRLHTVPLVKHVVRLYLIHIITDIRYILKVEKDNLMKLRLIFRNFFLALATIFAQYKGAKDEIRKRPIRKMKGI